MGRNKDIDSILEAIDQLRASQRQTDEQMRRTDERLDRLGVKIGELTGGWGRFVEDLMAPSIQAQFQERGFKVQRMTERLRAKDDGQVLAEYDVVLFGLSKNRRRTVVLVSVKSRVKVQDVRDLIAELERFHELFPEYRNHALTGAIAGVGFPDSTRKYAEKAGLYVIRTADDVACLLNKPDFQPKLWTHPKSRKKR